MTLLSTATDGADEQRFRGALPRRIAVLVTELDRLRRRPTDTALRARITARLDGLSRSADALGERPLADELMRLVPRLSAKDVDHGALRAELVRLPRKYGVRARTGAVATTVVVCGERRFVERARQTLGDAVTVVAVDGLPAVTDASDAHGADALVIDATLCSPHLAQTLLAGAGLPLFVVGAGAGTTSFSELPAQVHGLLGSVTPPSVIELDGSDSPPPASVAAPSAFSFDLDDAPPTLAFRTAEALADPLSFDLGDDGPASPVPPASELPPIVVMETLPPPTVAEPLESMGHEHRPSRRAPPSVGVRAPRSVAAAVGETGVDHAGKTTRVDPSVETPQLDASPDVVDTATDDDHDDNRYTPTAPQRSLLAETRAFFGTSGRFTARLATGAFRRLRPFAGFGAALLAATGTYWLVQQLATGNGTVVPHGAPVSSAPLPLAVVKSAAPPTPSAEGSASVEDGGTDGSAATGKLRVEQLSGPPAPPSPGGEWIEVRAGESDRIYVDGEFVGTGPGRVVRVKPGRHELRVRRNDVGVAGPFDVAGGRPIRVYFEGRR